MGNKEAEVGDSVSWDTITAVHGWEVPAPQGCWGLLPGVAERRHGLQLLTPRRVVHPRPRLLEEGPVPGPPPRSLFPELPQTPRGCHSPGAQLPAEYTLTILPN